MLRLYEVLRDGTTTSTRQPIRDVEIHGGVNNWYIDVHNPPKSYQLDIGYLAPGGKFYCLARSNVVSTPPAAVGDTFDRNWAEVAKDFDRIFALSGGYSQPEANGDLREVLEERLQRPIGDPAAVQFGRGAAGPPADGSGFEFQVDTELIVHGVTQPDAHVTLRGEPVRSASDGTFAVRFNLPDRRHVLPMVASSRDGAEQRTIVLAVDRNTKVMEPVSHDARGMTKEATSSTKRRNSAFSATHRASRLCSPFRLPPSCVQCRHVERSDANPRQWPFEPDEVLVRIIPGDDGRSKVQLRVDLGMLQMEMDGRPDGFRPEGFESWLDYYEHRQQEHDETHPDAAPFLLERGGLHPSCGARRCSITIAT